MPHYARVVARGTLRIYLGFAPGAGTTYALLDEAHRRAGRGSEVVVAALDGKGRRSTEELVTGLELVGDRSDGPDGTFRLTLDPGAVLARRPRVVVVDDLAACDGEHARWHAVERLRDAGIDVVTTLDVSAVESLADVVAAITGLERVARVPDSVLRSAEQIQLIDQTPEALRRRLAHGNIFPAERVDAAVDATFRPETLAELRELTMRWLADRVQARTSTEPGDARRHELHEGIVVALSGAPSSPEVLRRAARLADRQGARLIGVHVRSVAAGPDVSPAVMDQRQLLEAMGGEYLEVASDDVADALIRVAVAERATQLVVGASHRGRWQEFRHGAVVAEIVRRSPVDVHVVGGLPPARPDRSARTRRRPPLVRGGRRLAGWVLAIGLPALVAEVLVAADRHLDLAAQLIVMPLAVTAAAAVGGAMAGAAAALWAFVLANWCFIPPVHELSISNPEDALSLGAFLVVAIVIGSYVSVAARRSAEAVRARADASALASLAGTAAATDNPLPAVVDRLRVAYGGVGATLFDRVGGLWVVMASAGFEAPSAPDGVALSLPVTDTTRLAIDGPDLRGVDPEVTAAFLDQLALTVDRQRLRAAEEESRSAAAANELRAALLAAVSHDLRTPLATVKAASSTLAQLGESLSPAERSELLATVDNGVDRLTALVVNLLGMGRIQAGVVELDLRELVVDEVVHQAVLDVGPTEVDIRVDVPEVLPSVTADRPLLVHVLVNLIDNACTWSPAAEAVRVDALVVNGALHVRVVDRGPGIPVEDRDRVLEPFQRSSVPLGEGRSAGTGLGLAVAAGFCALMDLELRLEDTPGGGTTATVVMPVSRDRVGTDVER